MHVSAYAVVIQMALITCLFKGAMTRPTHAEVQVGHDFNNRILSVHIFFQLAAQRCGI